MKKFCSIMVFLSLILSLGACNNPTGESSYNSESQESSFSSSSSLSSQSESSLASSSAASSSVAVSQAANTPASSRASTAPVSSVAASTAPVSSIAASSTPEPSKPLAIADPVADYLLRAYAGKLSGDLYPEDFSEISSYYGCIHFSYQDGKTSFMSESIDGPPLSTTTGMVINYLGMSKVPFRKFVLSYVLSSADITIPSVNLTGFPVTVNYFKVYSRPYGSQNVDFINFAELRKCTSMEVIYMENAKGIDMDTILSFSKLKILQLFNCSPVDMDKVNQLIARGVSVDIRDCSPD